MKPSWQRPEQIERSSLGGNAGEEQPVRLWLVGSLSLVLVACVVAALVYFGGLLPGPTGTSTSDVGGVGLKPSPPTARITARLANAGIGGDRHDPLGSVAPPPDEAVLPLQVPVESSTEEDNEPPVFDSVALGDPATLRVYLSGGDPVLADAALQAASRHDKEMAARAILDVVRDGAEPRRLEVLQRLCASPYVDEETRTSALRTALQDSDSALVTHAIRTLSDRSDATALGLLSEAFEKGELSTRLSILESIASNGYAEPLLRQGLKDPEEAVRNTAQAVMSIRSSANAGTKESL